MAQTFDERMDYIVALLKLRADDAAAIEQFAQTLLDRLGNARYSKSEIDDLMRRAGKVRHSCDFLVSDQLPRLKADITETV